MLSILYPHHSIHIKSTRLMHAWVSKHLANKSCYHGQNVLWSCIFQSQFLWSLIWSFTPLSIKFDPCVHQVWPLCPSSLTLVSCLAGVCQWQVVQLHTRPVVGECPHRGTVVDPRPGPHIHTKSQPWQSPSRHCVVSLGILLWVVRCCVTHIYAHVYAYSDVCIT